MKRHFNELDSLKYMAPKIIAIINMKGGVGKTTLTWNLAQHLFSKHDKKVLIIDLDPQANATILGLSEDEYKNHKMNKKTIADIFINCYRKYGPFPNKAIKTITDYKNFIFRRENKNNNQIYLDLVPSELDLSAVLKGAYIDPFMLENMLKHQFFSNYDYILIDCAPTNSNLTTLSLNAAKKILVPVMADTFAVYGVDLMKEVIKTHKDDFDVDVKIIGLVFMRWEQKKVNQQKYKEKIVSAWGGTTFRTHIRNNDWYKIANGKRSDISESPAHTEVKEEFDDFTREFIEKTK